MAAVLACKVLEHVHEYTPVVVDTPLPRKSIVIERRVFENGIETSMNFQQIVSTKQTGMGIGLVICHTIIEGHGGRLVHERRSPGEPAGSALFRITLPVPQHAGESA
jgi:nitrogen-specific signal transduction histidine kinase